MIRYVTMVCVSIALGLTASGVHSCMESEKAARAQYKAQGCHVHSETYTGRNIYCGKACFKKEIERVHHCRVEPFIRVERY